jgi:hypothetical protein
MKIRRIGCPFFLVIFLGVEMFALAGCLFTRTRPVTATPTPGFPTPIATAPLPTQPASLPPNQTQQAAEQPSRPAPTTLPQNTRTPDASTLQVEVRASNDANYKESALITLGSKGQTITINLGTRFFVFLDDEKYPVKSLTCKPDWVMGTISNGSFNGPDLYPILYEATIPGRCTLQSGDFSVDIIVLGPTQGPVITP